MINLDDYTWYNDYTKPTNISMQFICKKYYYHCASKVPYDSYVYDDPSGIFRTTDNNNTNMAANSLAMGGLAFAYIPDGVRKIVYDYEWDCINIPSSVEEIENDRFDFSNLKYVFIDKNSSIIESLSSELIESNPNVKIYSSDNYHICEAVFVINK